ncbi:MAG: alpha amylase C-terminal domain-containing protein [Streptococcaceae bacterium]|nr:alpha amylase C-terminal domain-containing protein [Streptococcaceae bacterium]
MEKKIESIEDSYEIQAFFRGESRHSWKYFGHHPLEKEGKPGFIFRLWAPNAQNVYLAGDFTQWIEDEIPMEQNEFGIWEVWTDAPTPGDLYKFDVRQVNAQSELRTDPYGFRFESRELMANMVVQQNEIVWKDEEWSRRNKEFGPENIYFAKIDEWRVDGDGKPYSLERLQKEFIPYLIEMNYTHVCFKIVQAILENEETEVSIGLFAYEESYGESVDFRLFVQACHQAGIGVFLDVNISQFSSNPQSLSYYDGTPQFEYLDRNRAKAVKYRAKNFDLGKPEVVSYLTSFLFYWIESYHIDGFRLPLMTNIISRDQDGGPWNPNNNGGRKNLEGIRFIQHLNKVLQEHAPHVKFYGSEKMDRIKVSGMLDHGGLGMDLKENDFFLSNVVKFYSVDPIYRKYQYKLLQEVTEKMYDDHYLIPLTTSVETEQEGIKGLFSIIWGDEEWKKYAQLRNLLVYQKAHPGSCLQQMGIEFANETGFGTPLRWENLFKKKAKKLQHFVMELNRLYLEEQAFWLNDNDMVGFLPVDIENKDETVLSFIREGETPEDSLLILLNMTPVERSDFYIGVPYWGEYEEILNSEMYDFGGNWKVGNERLHSLPWKDKHLPYQIHVTLPSFGALVIKPKAITHSPPESVVAAVNDITKANELIKLLALQGFKV